MLRIISLLSLLGIITACGQQNDFNQSNPLFTGVDYELQPYFDQFTALSGVSTGTITGGFLTLSGNIAGECVWGGAWNEVRIDPDDWSNYNNDEKQQLISHELGHCALYLQHINNCSDGTTAPDGTESSCNSTSSLYPYPLSIMNWQMFNQQQASYLTSNSTQYYQYLKLNLPIP